MYTIEIDGNVCYAPNLAYRGYAVINPVHTAEINKADTLTFTVPPNNPLYGSIQPLTSDVTLRWDGEILCHGRVLNRGRDFQNQKKLTCEGALAWLNDSIIPPHTGTWTVSDYVDYILDLHNEQVEANRQLQVGTISDVDIEDLEPGTTISYDVDALARQVIAGQWGVGTDRRQRLEAEGYSYELIQNKVNELLGVSYRYTVETTQSASSTGTTLTIEVTDYTTALSRLTAEWLSEQGYTIRARSVDENGGIVTYIDLLSRNGVMGEQTVQFAKNLLDLDELTDAADIYTCVIPLGKATDGVPLTIADVNGGKNYLENTTLSALYGKIYRTINHSDIETAAELLAAGRNDVKECLSGSLLLNVKAVDLSLAGDETDRFFVGGYNQILSIPHGFSDTYLMCTKIQTNLQDPSKTSYTFGATSGTLTAKVSSGVSGAAAKTTSALVNDSGYVKDEDVPTYSEATTSAAGLMSAADKTKINSLFPDDFGRYLLSANTSRTLTLSNYRSYIVSSPYSVWIVFSLSATSTPIIIKVASSGSTWESSLTLTGAANKQLTLANSTTSGYYFQVSNLIHN